MNSSNKSNHIALTSHPSQVSKPSPIVWGANSAQIRGPVIGLPGNAQKRNAIGTHTGSYAVYRALAVVSGELDPLHKPDLTNTSPAVKIGPHPQWFDAERIVSIDPWGHLVGSVFQEHIDDGESIRPTIAVTRARLNVPEIASGAICSSLEPDGKLYWNLERSTSLKLRLNQSGIWKGLRRDSTCPSMTCVECCMNRPETCFRTLSPVPT